MSKRSSQPDMKVIPRFVYNPEKADRGLKAMADILAHAIQKPRIKESVTDQAAR